MSLPSATKNRTAKTSRKGSNLRRAAAVAGPSLTASPAMKAASATGIPKTSAPSPARTSAVATVNLLSVRYETRRKRGDDQTSHQVADDRGQPHPARAPTKSNCKCECYADSENVLCRSRQSFSPDLWISVAYRPTHTRIGHRGGISSIGCPASCPRRACPRRGSLCNDGRPVECATNSGIETPDAEELALWGTPPTSVKP
jgi:hypothetical protein